MAEFIDRETVIDNVLDQMRHSKSELCMRERLLNLEAADVVPVKSGEWLCVGHDDTTYFYRCSNCGFEAHNNMTKHDRFCRSCGARMDGEA